MLVREHDNSSQPGWTDCSLNPKTLALMGWKVSRMIRVSRDHYINQNPQSLALGSRKCD